MDQFGSLSIEDEFESKLTEDELLSISTLSISDASQRLSANILNKYMQHFPTSPSPLRNSTNFLEAFSDEMDVDEEFVEQDKETITESIHTIEEALPKVTFELPDIGRKRIEKEKVVEKKGHKEKARVKSKSDKEDNAEEINVNSKQVFKALLSPTSLGIAAATKIEGLPVEYAPHEENESKLAETHNCFTTQTASTGWDSAEIKEELRLRNKTQPIQVSINNHHHYYPSTGGYYTESESAPFIYKQQTGYDRQQDVSMHEYDKLKLPVPWSENSRPFSKHSYDIMSYLQLFLNCITITTIFSFITSFIRTLRKDIKSTWEHRKLELNYESSLCKNHYLANECHIQVRPALKEQCQQWDLCMNRNNDIFFRARSTLSAKLFGEIINSFIEPIGWKALSVVIISIVVWSFCSNFLLGFARAKSYYGAPSRQLLALQQEQQLLQDQSHHQRQAQNRNHEHHHENASRELQH
ncbi:hypothetical protein HG535_0A04290 [Zygotorulaspora mrakii]|uniref:Brl1/Brr6 domain-containing protein n=1 Tax=Zygotorulaspora mrakii TaxID=42260 RepID=A0A7H9AXH4_ZYGMR|nr:uncharacterized protein HG535_0A04290 [Zygotorulaspora mrakii]QLG70489.1 hypothetical protein HG535_0A04290 [Zygotorulaspora mrakii]